MITPSALRVCLGAVALVHVLLLLRSAMTPLPEVAGQSGMCVVKHSAKEAVDRLYHVPGKFRMPFHRYDLLGQETVWYDEMFQGDTAKDKEYREVIEEVWRHLEQVEPQWEMESVIRCDRVVDRRFGTMYTAEVSLSPLKRATAPQSLMYRTVQLYRPLLASRVISDRVVSREVKEKVNLLVALRNRCDMLTGLLENVRELLARGDAENIRLVIVDFFSSDCHVTHVVAQYLAPAEYLVVRLDGPFSKVAGLNAAADAVPGEDELLFFLDVDMIIPDGLLDIIRRESIAGQQVVAPICFSLYKDRPPITDNANGYWRTYGYGNIAMYKSDFERVGRYDDTQFGTAWGGEDLELVDRLVDRRYRIFRAKEVGFIHRWHHNAPWRECSELETEEERLNCFAVEVDQLGSKMDIAKLYLKTMRNDECIQSQQDEGHCREPKIYVYPLSDEFNHQQLRANKRQLEGSCENSFQSAEVIIHRALLLSRFITFDADDADFYYVPIYGHCFLENNDPLGEALGGEFYRKALAGVVQQYPYFNRTHGMDHVFAFSHTAGPRVTGQWERIQNSIFLSVGATLTSRYFSPWKDIAIPPLLGTAPVWESDGFDVAVPREYTAMMSGSLTICDEMCSGRMCCNSGSARNRAAEAMHKMADFVYAKAAALEHTMQSSTFCLFFDGWHLEEYQPSAAILSGCIPVLFGRDVLLPLNDLIDYEDFVVHAKEGEDLAAVWELLRNFEHTEVVRRRRAMSEVWPRLMYHTAVEMHDAVESIVSTLSQRVCKRKVVGR